MSTLCVYPLSPSYSFLPRLNTYLLLVAVLYGPADNWATKGALAAMMTRTAAQSLHAFALLGVLEWELHRHLSVFSFDSDIIGTWAVLSITATAVPMMLAWAPSVANSKARPLVRIWSVLVTAASICAYVGIHRVADLPANGNKCVDAGSFPMRQRGEPIAIAWSDLFLGPPKGQILRGWDIAVLLTMSFGIWGCLRPRSVGRVKDSKWDGIVGSSQVQQSTFDNFVCSPFTCAVEMLFLTLDIIVFYGLVVLNELWLWEAKIPALEGLDAFESWGVWVATGLVILATIVNWVLGRRSKPKPRPYCSSQPPNLEAGNLGGTTKGLGVTESPSVIR
jgi:hypothetical protein